MGTRRKAREMALQGLYTIDLIGAWEENSRDVLPEKHRWPASASFAEIIISGIQEHRTEIDRTIEAHANYWSISRMSLIDRNILRIATFELLFCDDIPRRVSINEAIELAKLYGALQTKSFLNGILDKIEKIISE